MGLDAATEALRWGVNDLGGTLMEESISRLAGSYHGVKLDPDDLVAAAHRAGRPAAERTTLYDDPPPLPAGRRRGLSDHADVVDVAEEGAGAIRARPSALSASASGAPTVPRAASASAPRSTSARK